MAATTSAAVDVGESTTGAGGPEMPNGEPSRGEQLAPIDDTTTTSAAKVAAMRAATGRASGGRSVRMLSLSWN
jgi:hypothetical protein